MINFLIFIECMVFAEMLLLLIFGPNFFDYFFLSIFILILTIPALIMLSILIVSTIHNPLVSFMIILVIYILFKFLPFP